MDIQKINQKETVDKKNENILVVRRGDLFPSGAWQGLRRPDISSRERVGQDFVETIMAKKEFLPRPLMENDPTYKQIIPYLIFKFYDRSNFYESTCGELGFDGSEHDKKSNEAQAKYFLMQRKAKASETRLKSKYSFGIGGHIRQEDIKTDNIAQWAEREFNEEVEYSGNLDIKFLGVLNDDSNDVGKVHVGFIYLLEGDSSEICVKDELESGILLTLDECLPYYDLMEEWSKIVFDFLRENLV